MNHCFTSFDACLGSLSCWKSHPLPMWNRAHVYQDVPILLLAHDALHLEERTHSARMETAPHQHRTTPVLNSRNLVLGIEPSANRAPYIRNTITPHQHVLALITPQNLSQLLLRPQCMRLCPLQPRLSIFLRDKGLLERSAFEEAGSSQAVLCGRRGHL